MLLDQYLSFETNWFVEQMESSEAYQYRYYISIRLNLKNASDRRTPDWMTRLKFGVAKGMVKIDAIVSEGEESVNHRVETEIYSTDKKNDPNVDRTKILGTTLAVYVMDH